MGLLRALRVWHHGSLLWSSFMERSLAKITPAGPARVVRIFLYGGCDRLAARESTPTPSVTNIIEICNHSEPPIVPDKVTDEIMANVMWAQRVELEILAGMHDPNLTGKTATSCNTIDENSSDIWMDAG